MPEFNDKLKELGRVLTERRESLGMTLETVFDRTKIRPEYLKGIEEGDYTDFPETVYIKGFVRTYLKLINAEDLQEEFMAYLDRTDRTQPQRRQEIRHQKSMNDILGNGSSAPQGFKPTSHFWLFFALVMALIGTGGYVWYAVSNGGLDLKNLKLFSFYGNNNSPVEISADINPETDIEISDAVVSEEPVISEEPKPEIKPFLEIHAVNDVWLSVRFGNSQPVYSRTLKRGDSMRWDLSSPARVVIGRPNAAQVILNGKDLGIINPSAKRSETHIYNPDGTTQKIK